MFTSRKIAGAIFLLLAAYGAGVLFLHGTGDTPTTATVLPAPMPLPEFALTDHDGTPFGRDELRGSWQLLFFGFTHCPDICPATLQQLAVAKKRLADAGQGFPEIILVSVDPERDTPAVLADYVSHFGAGIRGVTGSPEEIARLTAPLGIYHAKSGEEGGNYSVDHSAVVLLIDESGQWHALFSAPHNVENFVHDIPLLTGGA